MNYELRIKKQFVRIITIILILLMGVPNAVFAQTIEPSAALASESSSTSASDPTIQAIEQLSNPSATDSGDISITPTPYLEDQTSFSSAQPKTAPIIRTLAKHIFRGNERVNVIVDNAQGQTEVSVFDIDGNEVEFEEFTIDEGNRKTAVVKPPPYFKPGKYTIKVTSGGQTYEQDFLWGVLAINTNKSIYLPGETAKLAIAVLDEMGEMVCDARVTLKITDPSQTETILSTDAGNIKVNEQCQKKEVTITPDYESEYKIEEGIGNYQMSLAAETKNGSYSITDAFEVRKSVPFDVERKTATRIFPPNPYPVDLEIRANQDFDGVIAELVPGSFAIDPSSRSDYAFEEIKTTSAESAEGVLGVSTAQLGLPFEKSWPISQEFGQHLRDPYEKDLYSRFNLAGHDGIDFDLPEGTNVLAVDDGKVVMAGQGAYGITVVIEHSWGRSYYGHLSFPKAALDQEVKKGDLIALSGNTGLSTGPHLHFSIKLNSPDVQNGYYGKTDPLPVLGIQSNLDPANQLKLITWRVSVKKGEKFVLSYFYKAPNISPEFYKLGPLRFYENQQNIFQETRQWQIAVDADGSGANTVSPTTGATSATGQAYTFTFDPSETMDSGGITIQEPTADDWTVPQGTAGSAGYTTAVGTGTATVGDVLNNADVEDPTSPAGVWKEIDPDMCGSSAQDAAGDIVVDTTTKKEGTGSIMCEDTNGLPDNNDDWGFVYDSNQNWETFCNGGDCTQIGWWQRAVVATEAFEFDVSSTTDISTAITGASCAGSVTSANTWEYRTCDISTANLTTVKAFGFSCTNNTCNPFETDRFWVDEFLIGPGVPTFSGTSPWLITVRFLDLAAANTVTVTYGSGGGSSGVTNSATAAVHAFTTQSKTLVDGTYTSISSHPTVTLSSGPTNDQLMRHGKWLDAGTENAFTF